MMIAVHKPEAGMGHDEYIQYYYAQALYILGDAGYDKLCPGTDPAERLTWSKYRGPGAVTFDKAKPEVEKLPAGTDNTAFSGKATTNVKFSEPGDYVLHLTVNDYSGDGGGGFQCCWTTGLLKVSVKP